VLRWDAVAAVVHETNVPQADGEIVWTGRPMAGVSSRGAQSVVAKDGDNKAQSPPGRARISCKAIAQGMSEYLPLNLYARVRYSFYPCARDRGVQHVPGIPAPLFREGGTK